jgi:hypothetical protein
LLEKVPIRYIPKANPPAVFDPPVDMNEKMNKKYM